MVEYVPERGDVVYLNFNPQAGHEQSGKRPALVLSPKVYNQKTGLAVFCPLTSQIKGYPFESRIPDGLKVHGAVLSDQVKSMDWRARGAIFVCKIPSAVLEDCQAKIGALLFDPS